jgi:PAS domain S-box-containing protein
VGVASEDERIENEPAVVRSALDALDDSFFVFDLDGDFIHWNTKLTAVTGYTDAEVAGMTPTDFVASEDVEAIVAAIGRVVSDGRAKEEASLVTKSGEHVPYEFTGALLEDEDGTIGICGIGRDITNRKHRERALEQQAERLRTTNRINEIIRDVNQALVHASTREEIERAVCTNLAGEEAYRFAWIGERRMAEGGVEPHEWAGGEASYLDDRPGAGGESDDVTAETAIATGEIQVAQSIATDPAFSSWREAALSHGFGSAVAIPLVYRETAYGVLCVYSPRPNAFDETEREVLEELGETIAYAFSAAERRRALVSDVVVELEFALRDRSIFTIDLTAETGCRVTLDGIVERSDGSLVEFVTITGTDPETVLALSGERENINATLVSNHEGESVFQFISESSSTTSLADMGGVIREGVAEDGEGRLVFELPQEADMRAIVEAVVGQYDDTELVAQRERERTSTRGAEFRAVFDDALTDRQREVLKTAYLSGFFEWPHESDGNEIAASLDISRPTFHEHIRTGQRKLLDAYFENGDPY